MLLSWLFALTLLLKTTSAFATERKVIFSCVHFPPSKFETPVDGLPGFVIEFLNEAFARSGLTVEYKYYPWSRALSNAMNGTVDGLCSCSYHPDRDEKLIYSTPLGENNAVIFFRNSEAPPQIKSISELTGQTVAVVRGYNLHKELISKNVKPMPVNDEKSGIKLLLKKRIDLFYSFKAPGQYALSKYAEKDEIGHYVVSTQPYFACISKSRPKAADTIRLLNGGLSAIRKDGTYDRILDKYR